MSSSNFTFDDIIQAVRKQLNDDAQRRWTDADILSIYLPRIYQQLRSDSPHFFIGTAWSENYKPSQNDPLPFADEGFNQFVEMLLAAIQEQSSEAVSAGIAAAADARAQRAGRG